MENENNRSHYVDENCDLCGLCVVTCTQGAMMVEESRATRSREDLCDGCGVCEETCPQEAISCSFGIVWSQDEEAAPPAADDKRRSQDA